ncbi:MAG: hypothetical protein KC503_13240 [Myxococcales bacterium]|nr:hypothetical protein [Myxococcales bacterium]
MRLRIRPSRLALALVLLVLPLVSLRAAFALPTKSGYRPPSTLTKLTYRMLLKTQQARHALGRWRKLASDPAHGGQITETSKREALVGLRLERAGKLAGPIVRESTGSSEFIDAKGQRWDVKAFNSRFPQKSGGFRLDRALRKLETQFAGGENVILDTANLSRDHLQALKRALHERGHSHRVLWYP